MSMAFPMYIMDGIIRKRLKFNNMYIPSKQSRAAKQQPAAPSALYDNMKAIYHRCTNTREFLETIKTNYKLTEAEAQQILSNLGVIRKGS